jgi:hypothetical protein
VVIVFLFVIMKTLSPRIWAFSDYPKSITAGVPPQTRREKQIAAITTVPFMILVIVLPIWSTLMLESSYGGTIPLMDAFLNLFGILLIFNISDFLILDFLIVGTITPDFVIIPGTERMKEKEYREFRYYHGKAHVRSILALAVISFVLAAIIVIV